MTDRKVSVEDLAPTPDIIDHSFLTRFPNLLAAKDLKEVVNAIRSAKYIGKPVIFGFGGAVIKSGCSRIVCEMVRSGIFTGLITNGSSLVHDVELALFEKTSEDISSGLVDGTFGMTDETLSVITRAINTNNTMGLGEKMGWFLVNNSTTLTNTDISIFATCYEYSIPICVSVALGNDIWHPRVDWGLVGKAARIDFDNFTSEVGKLGDGGVLLHFGSAVILPETILKSIMLCRARGISFEGMVACDFDFIRQYRPMTRIVETTNTLGGRGYHITGCHEITLPLLGGLILGSVL